MPKPNKKVFLSYSYQDRPWIEEFVSSLQKNGIDVWYDVKEIQAGERWMSHVQEALRQSSTLVIVLSSHSLKSPWVYFEIGAAVADRKRIIPVLVGDIEFSRMPALLAQFQSLRAESPAKAGEQVAQVVQQTADAEAEQGAAPNRRPARQASTRKPRKGGGR
jgi:TIR domain